MARDEESPLMMPHEVAAAFRVDPKTVARWAQTGKLPCVILPSGHRRFRRAVIERLLEGEGRVQWEQFLRGA